MNLNLPSTTVQFVILESATFHFQYTSNKINGYFKI